MIELWRLLLVSTAILVLVVSFAATSKYLVDGKIGVGAALWFTLYAIPPMLQYALPFSACFAAVLTHHRMATDNELLAARAGGLSYRHLLAPAAVTGVILTLFMGVLGEQIIPRFLRRMQSTITQDLAVGIKNSVEEGRPIDLKGVLVHADAAQEFEPDPSSGAYAGLRLLHPVALQVSSDGMVESTTTASFAWVFLTHSTDERTRDEGTDVYMQLENAATWANNGATGSGTVYARRYISGSFNDSPKYMTYRELRDLPKEPERSNVVDRARRDLAMRLARERVIGSLDESLKSRGTARFTDADERTYTIRASGIRATATEGVWQCVPAKGAKVEVEVQTPSGEAGKSSETRLMQAENATLRHDLDAERTRGQISMTLAMTGVSVRTRERAVTTQLPDRIYPGLGPSGSPLPELLKLNSRALLDEASARGQGPGQGGGIADAASELERRIASLTREVRAKSHERMAIAVTCIVMVLFGAVTAIRLEKRLPLVVYAWCFFPALVAVLSVNVGQSVAISSGLPGVGLIWLGLVLLAGYALLVERRVARH
jgi:hypothetical protein